MDSKEEQPTLNNLTSTMSDGETTTNITTPNEEEEEELADSSTKLLNKTKQNDADEEEEEHVIIIASNNNSPLSKPKLEGAPQSTARSHVRSRLLEDEEEEEEEETEHYNEYNINNNTNDNGSNINNNTNTNNNTNRTETNNLQVGTQVNLDTISLETAELPQNVNTNINITINNNNNNTNNRSIGESARHLLQLQHIRQLQNSLQRLNRTTIWKKGNFAMILYFTPLTVALITVLMVDWHKDCQQHLKEWAILQVFIQLCLIINNIVVISKLPPANIPRQVEYRRLRALWMYHRVNRTLSFAWFVWFVVGMVWTFQALASDTCSETAPFLFRMCFSLVIIQLILIGFIILFCCCSCILVGLRIFVFPFDEFLTGTESTYNRRGASPDVIDSLTSKQFREGMIPKEDASCAICLSDYENGDIIKYLPCNHHFHAGCVDMWLPTNKSCPFCKREVDAPVTSSPSITRKSLASIV